MEKLIKKFWADMFEAVTTQDASKILQNFAEDAAYKFRPAEGMTDNIPLADMAESCLGYKSVLAGKYNIERIEKLADGSWLSIITANVGKPYFTTSFFKFRGDKIIELVEYYGDF